MANIKQSEIDEMAKSLFETTAKNTIDAKTQEVQQDVVNNRRRRRQRSSLNVDETQDVVNQDVVNQDEKLDMELTKLFGPIDKNMSNPDDKILAHLVDVFPSDNDQTNGKKYLILEVEFEPNVAGLENVNVPKQRGLIHLNTQVVKDYNVNQEQRTYVDNEKRKAYLDNLVAYVFKDYGINRFEDVFPVFDKMLNEGKEITFPIYQYIFKSQGSNGSTVFRTSLRLINRVLQSDFIEVSQIDENLWKASVAEAGSVLPVKVLQIRDNLNSYQKDGEDFMFARWEVYVSYQGKNYLVKYNYQMRDKATNQRIQEVDYQTRIAYAREIADYLGLTGSITDIIENQFKNIANMNLTAKIAVTRSNVVYKHGNLQGQPVYYAKLA